MKKGTEEEAQVYGKIFEAYFKKLGANKLIADEIQAKFTQNNIKRNINEQRVAELNNGKANIRFYEDIFDAFDIHPSSDRRLGCVFAQGLWSSPILLLALGKASSSKILDKIKFAAYTNDENGKIIWNENGKPLPKFEKDSHNYFYSGEVKSYVRDGDAEIGFLGSLVANNKDLLKVCRIVNGEKTRHSIAFLSRKDKYKNDENETDKNLIMKALLTKLANSEKNPDDKIKLLFQDKSTAEKEYQDLLQEYGHETGTINVINTRQLKSEITKLLNAKIDSDNKNKDRSSVAIIGLKLSATIISNLINENKTLKNNFTVTIIQSKELYDLASRERKDINKLPFLYDMVMLNNHDKLKNIENFDEIKTFLKELGSMIDDLMFVNKTNGIPDLHKSVADFYGLDKQETSDELKTINFDLLYYQEFVDKLLNTIKEKENAWE